MLKPIPGPALRVCVCNQKGGVGKSTSVCHICRAASIRGLRVLVIDADPQGNTTKALAPDGVLEQTSPGLAHLLTGEYRGQEIGFDDVVIKSIWDGVDLIPTPGEEQLINTQNALATMSSGREYQLSLSLEPVLIEDDRYDLVLFDLQPSLGQLLINALTAAELALIVTQPEEWSSDGLGQLHKTISQVRRYNNAALRSVGPLVNLYDKSRSQHARAVQEDLVPAYAEMVADPNSGHVTPVWGGDDEIIFRRAAIGDYLQAGIGLDEASREIRAEIEPRYGATVQRLLEAGRKVRNAA